MTLATRVRIVTPLPPEQVFHKCRELLEAGDATWEHRESWNGPEEATYANDGGQGLRALLRVTYGIDGPLLPADEEVRATTPRACLEAWFDTSYGYRDEQGGCEALHRRLTAELGEWLDDRNADWWAQDEFSGVWYHRTPCPVP